ncbi:MAG: lasso RiPP family leader peptide-containing protein [Desulfobacterales bacterium]|nr:lasso RiPP family leader peptide-containing protein [Desulfobacterales bacterium]
MKREYEKPELVEYADLKNLTAGGTASDPGAYEVD